ncbi:hypothetical protein BDN72DRAFT_889649 [Pluteus cervinus]|uniref:Uncharacterized protein n=1 Tax=Pluteus cervinus TaxID=181527 RepID=A0ACD3AFG8_9AGAR|nr:hypothetical protein BDN72DRAFT_889649 [Pluteus cervinus]
MPPVKPPAPRKRNRKRKRRVASSDSSSSSEDSASSASDNESKIPQKPALPTAQQTASKSDDSESESSSDSSDSESDEWAEPLRTLPGKNVAKQAQTAPVHRHSPSPPPQSVELPSFLPTGGEDDPQREQLMKEKFRKFWLSAVADGFKDDLEEIRKEPNLSTSRLGLLIDSLAAGADVFTSSESMNGIKEYEIILE